MGTVTVAPAVADPLARVSEILCAFAIVWKLSKARTAIRSRTPLKLLRIVHVTVLV